MTICFSTDLVTKKFAQCCAVFMRECRCCGGFRQGRGSPCCRRKRWSLSPTRPSAVTLKERQWRTFMFVVQQRSRWRSCSGESARTATTPGAMSPNEVRQSCSLTCVVSCEPLWERGGGARRRSATLTPLARSCGAISRPGRFPTKPANHGRPPSWSRDPPAYSIYRDESRIGDRSGCA